MEHKNGRIIQDDKNGVVISEETISNEQRLSLDARIRLGMSQQQFAKMLGISRSYVSRVEKHGIELLREALEQLDQKNQ